jgi:hypothetical protein
VYDVNAVGAAVLNVNRLVDLLIPPQGDCRTLPAVEADDCAWPGGRGDFIEQRRINRHIAGAITGAVDD